MENIKLKVTVDRTELNNIIGDVNKLQGKEIKVEVETSGLKEGENTVKNFSNQLEKAGMKTNYLASQMKNRLVNGAITTVVKSLRDALTEMKAVDTEMTSLQMSTCKTAGELKALRDSAYETASALGTTASEYLKTVSDFSNAGYTEQADELGKLAVMAARVGNTTQETANQYLIAIDRAYQYEGNVRKLTASLDGANAISNEYATNMDKIAAGFAEVGPVSAQAQVGIDEVTAALGTITAVTQGTGEEAGEALKSVFLGIMGDTQTEISDGVRWTAGELSGLTDMIKEYAPEAYGAAEATNSMLDPMTVIGELAESMQSGLLTEQELMSAFAGMGDKLDTTQLTALIENWDMYENMLGTYATSTGSAAREYEVYLDSWEAKTSQLSASWTEFISHLIETDGVKAVLDGLITVVELLDTDIGRGVVTVISLTSAASGLIKIFPLIKDGLSSIKISALSPQIIALGVAITALYAAYTSIKQIGDEIQAQDEKRKETIKELNEEYRVQFGSGSEYESLKSRVGDLTEEEEKRLDILEKQNEALKTRIRLGMQEDYDKITSENEGAKDSYGGLTKTETTWQAGIGYRDIEVTTTVSEAVSDLHKELESGNISLDDFRTGLQDIADTARDDYDTLINWKNADGELTESQNNFIDSYEDLILKMDVFNGKCDTQGNLLTAEKSAIQSATFDVIDLMNSQYGLAISYGTTTEELLKLLSAQEKMSLAMAVQQGLSIEERKEWANRYKNIRSIREGLEAEIKAASGAGGNKGNNGNNGKGGGTDGNGNRANTVKATKDEQLETLKDTVSLRKSELDLIEAQSGSVGSQLIKMREIQASLSQQADYMRGHEGSLEEINKLSSEWWSWQDKIEKLQKNLQSELESSVNSILKDAQDARDKKLKAINEEIEAERKNSDEKQRQVDLQEKENAVIEARRNLENAMRERTVRVFNAQTGQWEWTYNAKDVENAQKYLDDAKKALADKEEEDSSNAVIEELENEKKRIQREYDDISDSWSAVTKSLQTPTREISKILRDIAEHGTPEMKAQIENVTKILGDLGKYIGDNAVTQSESTQEIVGTSSSTKRKAHKAKADGTSDAKVGELAITGGGVFLKTDPNKPGVKVGTLENLIGKKTTKDPKEVQKALDRYNQTGVYDSGGILRGIGGIKATLEDEMVLPPDITRSLLSPTADSTFRRRLSEMNFMYGSAERVPAALTANVSAGGSQHYGDIYEYGNITLTSDQAKSLTVYELAQMSRTLGLYSNAN